MASDKSGFFEELKRRHVWRVAAAYVVAAWLLVQIATQVFPFFDIPNWAVRLVVVLLMIGFPAAVVLAWVYEITPQGIRRTEPADSPAALDSHVRHSMVQKLNAIITVALMLSVAVMGWRMSVMGQHGGAVPAGQMPAKRADPSVTGAGAVVPDAAIGVSTPVTSGTPVSVQNSAPLAASAKSVAVLPFANESGNSADLVFSDGLSQDLINALSQFDGLKVISRNSAFQFRDSKGSASDIGRKLGVAHLLEGSVQRSADQVRITATLVNAADGTIVWSQHYDRPYQDLFALQDAITRAVANALEARLVVAPGAVVQSDRPPSGDLAAFAAYQRGVASMAKLSAAGIREAIESFTEATRLDPGYAVAYARASIGWIELFSTSSAPLADVESKSRDAVEAALKIDPGSSLAHQARARFLQVAEFDWRGAEAEARRALELAPNDPDAKITLGLMLAKLGQVQRAAELTRQALESNPRLSLWYLWLTRDLVALGRLDEARQAIGTALALQPGADTFYTDLTAVEIQRGDPAAALAAARQEPNRTWREWAMALALQVGSDRGAAEAALRAVIDHQADTAAYAVVQTYALRRDPDAMFRWLDRAFAQRDPGISMVLYDPLVLRYRDDPRFAAFCKKAGLPTTTDAVAMK